MDPVGLSLEKFDAIGRRRTVEAGAPIDASRGLPDGNRFADVDGLEAALLRRPELFAGAFAEKLLTYASGRGVEATMRPRYARSCARRGRRTFASLRSFSES